jgi:hypothetical protein
VAATRHQRGVEIPPLRQCVTPDFTRKTECISYVCQDQNFTQMIDNRVQYHNCNQNIQEFNDTIFIYYTQTGGHEGPNTKL